MMRLYQKHGSSIEDDALRDILSPDGYFDLLAAYPGRLIYVASNGGPEQFLHVLSMEDAQAFYKNYYGSEVQLRSRFSDTPLAFSLLYMEGYIVPEICAASGFSAGWVRESMRLLERRFDSLTVLKAYRASKLSVYSKIPERNACVVRSKNYAAHLEEVKADPVLSQKLELVLVFIRRLRHKLPDDPTALRVARGRRKTSPETRINGGLTPPALPHRPSPPVNTLDALREPENGLAKIGELIT